MNMSTNTTSDHPMVDAHLSPQLQGLARAVEQERAQLSDAALRRIIAGTVPLIATPAEPVLRVVGPAPLARAGGGLGAMRMAASIAVVAGAGFAMLAQRSGQTPATMAQARVADRDADARAAAAQVPTPGADDVLLWESWLAAADVSRSDVWTDDASEQSGESGESHEGMDWLEISMSPVMGGLVGEEAL